MEGALAYLEADLIKPKFLTSEISKVTLLLAKLSELNTFLIRLEEKPKTEWPNLEEVELQLCNERMIAVKDARIKVLIASCVSQILKLKAPENPWLQLGRIENRNRAVRAQFMTSCLTMAGILDVFKFSFGQLKQKNPVLDETPFHTLQSLATSHALLSWVDYMDDVTDLVQLFYSILEENPDRNLANNFGAILTALLADLPLLRPGTVYTIVKYLVAPSLQSQQTQNTDTVSKSMQVSEEADEELYSDDDDLMETQEMLDHKPPRSNSKQNGNQKESNNNQNQPSVSSGKAHQVCCGLSEGILRSIVKPLEPYVFGFLKQALDHTIEGKVWTRVDSNSDTDQIPLEYQQFYHRHFFHLCVAIHAVDPDYLNRIISEMHSLLSLPDVEQRLATVQTLSFIFSDSRRSTACIDYGFVWNTFIGRFKDADNRIRIEMLHFAQTYLLQFSHPYGIEKMNPHLEERLKDRVDDIRLLTTQICKSVACDPHAYARIKTQVLSVLAERLMDRESKVRLEAIKAYGDIYLFSAKQLVLCYSLLRMEENKPLTSGKDGKTFLPEETISDNSSRFTWWKERFETHFCLIPSQILAVYRRMSVTPEERLLIENFFVEALYFKLGSDIELAIKKIQNKSAAAKKTGGALVQGAKQSKIAAGQETVQDETLGYEFSESKQACYHLLRVSSYLLKTEDGRKALTRMLEFKSTCGVLVRMLLELENSTHASQQNTTASDIIHALERICGSMKGLKLGQHKESAALTDQFKKLSSIASTEETVKRAAISARNLLSSKKDKSSAAELTLLAWIEFAFINAKTVSTLLKALDRVNTFKSAKASSGKSRKGKEVSQKPDDPVRSIFDGTEYHEEIMELLGGQSTKKLPKSALFDIVEESTLAILSQTSKLHPMYFASHISNLNSLLQGQNSNINTHVTLIIGEVAKLPAQKSSQEVIGTTFAALTEVALCADISQASSAAKALLIQIQSSKIEGSQQSSTNTRMDEDSDEDSLADSTVITPHELKKFFTKAVQQAIDSNWLTDLKGASAFATLAEMVQIVPFDLAKRAAKAGIKLLSSSLPTYSKKNLEQLSNQSVASLLSELHAKTRAIVEAMQFVVAFFKVSVPLQLNRTQRVSSLPSTPKKRAPARSPARSPGKRGKSNGSPTKSEAAEKEHINIFTMDDEVKDLFDNLKEELLRILEEHSQSNKLDQVCACCTSAFVLLKLGEFSKYSDALGVESFQALANLCISDESNPYIREEIRKHLFPNFTLSKPHRASYLALCAFFPDKKSDLHQQVAASRKWITQASSERLAKPTEYTEAEDAEFSRKLNSHRPESSLPWLVYALAHSELMQKDSPTYLTTWNYLESLISALSSGATNVDAIFQILSNIRLVQDTAHPESHEIHLVAELGIKVWQSVHVHEHAKTARTFSTDRRIALFLPSKMYSIPEDEQGKPLVPKSLPTYLPADFVPPEKHNKRSSLWGASTALENPTNRTPSKKRKASTPKKPRTSKTQLDSASEFESESESESEIELDYHVKRNTRTVNPISPAKSKRGMKGEEQEVPKSTPSKIETPNPRITRSSHKASKKHAEESVDDAEDYEDSMKIDQKESNKTISQRVTRSKANDYGMDIDEEADVVPKKETKATTKAATSSKKVAPPPAKKRKLQQLP